MEDENQEVWSMRREDLVFDEDEELCRGTRICKNSNWSQLRSDPPPEADLSRGDGH